MQDIARELKQGRPQQAAPRAQNVEEQLRDLQDSLASASDLKDQLEEMRRQKEQQEQESQGEQNEGEKSEGPDSSTSGSGTAKTEGGSKGQGASNKGEGGGFEDDEARPKLDFKMDITGVGNHFETQDPETDKNNLKAWQEEKVPPEYSVVVRKYFELLASTEDES